MNERRSAHRTQWAAQFAVASELCKRDYQVALTLGNHPAVDLMVVSPNGKPFLIDVKGLYKPTFWGVREHRSRENLFYVFAYVPDDGSNRFYVLAQEQVNQGIEAYRAEGLARGRNAEKVKLFPGVPWRFVQSHENAWHILPS
jgi:hypothetical protein